MKKMPIKSVKIKIPRKKRYFLMSQGSVNPIIRFLGQKDGSVARARTDERTDIHNDYCGHPFRVSGFCLQSIIKDRPNMELGSQIQHNFGTGLLPICLETSVLLIDGRFYFRYGPIMEVILIH